MKQVAGRLRLSTSRSTASSRRSPQFASDLDAATQQQLARGARTVEVLKQPQYQPMPVEQQVMIIYAVTNGFLDDVDVKHIREWERGFLEFIEPSHPATCSKDIRTKKALDDGHRPAELEGRDRGRSSRCFTGRVMAKGRELKGRIQSVENTRKITRTMEMVATSKLKRAQDRVVAARPYADALARGAAPTCTRRSWPSAFRCCAGRRRLPRAVPRRPRSSC